jgi:hypothetical protein
MSPAYLQQLIAIADKADAAGHGNKEAVYSLACSELGVSRATLLNQLKQVKVCKQRKRRADCGLVELAYEEAVIIAAYLSEGRRKNNRKITSLKETVEILRMNGTISAAVIDSDSGEMRLLSDSAIANGLRAYTLHPEQLAQATPHTNLQSLHPNHVWQVDASVCVIYYLPDGGSQLVELDQAVHYKNKPENGKAIEQFRVIRYVVVDHASGLIAYRYYPHAESGEHTVRFMAWAMASKDNGNPFNGKPSIVMVDPGATSGGLVKRFCQRVEIELIVNKVHNARAKGSVEKANHLVETSFEQTLKYLNPRPTSFDELNRLADRYQLAWNASQIHSRHKKTRLAAWLTITATQLRTTPSADVLLSLATKEPISRVVAGDLTINFKNRVWDVSNVPNVTVKGEVFVHWHPFIADTAMAVVIDETGYEQHIALRERVKNELGFFVDAAIIGEEHKARPDTIADTNRKAIQQFAAGTDSLKDTEKKRASKYYIPLEHLGINPLKASDAELPSFLPKRGTAVDLKVPTVTPLTLNHVEMGRWLRGRLGSEFKPALLQDLIKHAPSGMTEPELEQVLANLEAGKTATGKAQLRAV